MKILFVCRSNVGRSQMAEVLFNKLSKKHSSISAGVKVEERKYRGRKLIDTTSIMVPVMEEIDCDVSNKISKQITEKMVEGFDMVVVMANKDDCPKYLLDNKKVVFWKVEDPRHKGIEGHRKIRDEIKRKIEKLLEDIE
jgi:arsenate reductase (thioredoxin)